MKYLLDFSKNYLIFKKYNLWVGSSLAEVYYLRPYEMPMMKGCNQEFFKAEEVSWFLHISSTPSERKAPQGNFLEVCLLDTLKTAV